MSHYNHKQFKYKGRYDPSYTRVVMIEKHNVNILKISSNFHYRMQTVLNLIRQAQDKKIPGPSIVVPTFSGLALVPPCSNFQSWHKLSGGITPNPCYGIVLFFCGLA